MTTQTVNLQKLTRLPIFTVQVADKRFPDVVVQTPHKGNVAVPLKQEHYPFIFGSVTQTEKHFIEVYEQIKEIEEEATDYLFNKWKETLQDNN